ncbi:hypothetical protein [Gracilimonas sediminicola]|uniref:Uncharacterized protein n=1 Tax=Gracilimonas sediminicola TaxID=2952158 RepID=A0A9X2RB01_9BACT|nr:hypothetical protein [Gracilimonas sediminicola]MCP9290006.1 hypothetical protein [Gracilimonas sediminicola]
MPDINPYIEKIYEARRLLIERNQSDLQKAMVRAYASQIDRVLRLLRSGQLSQDNADRIIREIRTALQNWQSSIGDITKRYSVETIDGVGNIHSRVTKQIGEAFGTEMAFSLQGFRSDAFEAMFERRRLGAVDTFKTLNNWNAHGERAIKGIERVLQEGIEQGRAMSKIQADIARNLSFGNRDIQGLLDSVRGRGTFSLSDLKIGGSETTKTINKLLSDARRIAVTEIDVAYHEGDRIASVRSPIIKALKWQTSGRHDGLYSSPDICDIHEQADLYGLGPGVYYPETIPVKPHPNCGCTRLYVTREVSEWDKPKDAPSRPREATANEINEILQENKHSGSRTITDRYIETTLNQTNTDNQRAFRYYAKQEAA